MATSKNDEIVNLLERVLDYFLGISKAKFDEIINGSKKRGAIVCIFDNPNSLQNFGEMKSMFMEQSNVDKIEYQEGSKMVREYNPDKGEVVILAGVILDPGSEVDSLYLCRRFFPRDIDLVVSEIRERPVNNYEDFLTQSCVVCRKQSSKKCSKCGTKYCCREHQKIDWPKHKLICKQQQEENKKYARVVRDLEDKLMSNSYRKWC